MNFIRNRIQIVKKFIINNVAGISLVEILLALSILVLLITVVAGALIYGNESAHLAGSRSQASSIAEEGLEAVRNIRDNNFTNLVDGTYGLAVSGNQWVFSGSSDTIDIFTRQIVISTVDTNTKQIVATVSWQENAQRSDSIILTSYLTNWIAAASLPSWANPLLESSLDLSANQDGNKIQVQGNYAYIARSNGNPSFSVVDITNPASPSEVGSLNLNGIIYNLSVSGNYAYAVSSDNTREFQIVNITNPAAPSYVTSYDASGSSDSRGIFVVGTRAYFTKDLSSSPEFFIMNITNPASPTLLGSLNLTGTAYEVYVSGNYAYVASGSDTQELIVINVTNPAAPSVVGSYNLTGTSDAYTITGFGTTVVLGRSNGEIRLFNVTTPASPTLMGTYTTTSVIRDIDLGISNTYVFMATSGSTYDLEIIDITNPGSITFVGGYNYLDLYGVAYHSVKDRAFAVGPDDSHEFFVFAPQ
jgi:hypothetical protein